MLQELFKISLVEIRELKARIKELESQLADAKQYKVSFENLHEQYGERLQEVIQLQAQLAEKDEYVVSVLDFALTKADRFGTFWALDIKTEEPLTSAELHNVYKKSLYNEQKQKP